MTKRETMLRRLSAAQFTQWELHLYLDTHPSDLQALALFRKCDARYRALRSEYEAQFGALTALDDRCGVAQRPVAVGYRGVWLLMFVYEKKLQYPVKIANPNPKYAKIILDQYGGPDGELGASLRYLSQRFTMPYAQLKGLLTDIGTEELGHLEMIGAIVHQLTRNLTPEEIKKGGFDAYFVTHTAGVYPAGANGMPYSAGSMQCKGDTIADLMEDMAAEQKARVTYDNILRLVDDPDVRDPIKFLREREVVHFQRFGEGLRTVTDRLNSKNYYSFNPSFDKC